MDSSPAPYFLDVDVNLGGWAALADPESIRAQRDGTAELELQRLGMSSGGYGIAASFSNTGDYNTAMV